MAAAATRTSNRLPSVPSLQGGLRPSDLRRGVLRRVIYHQYFDELRGKVQPDQGAQASGELAGVTLRNRIIMPLSGSVAHNDHTRNRRQATSLLIGSFVVVGRLRRGRLEGESALHEVLDHGVRNGDPVSGKLREEWSQRRREVDGARGAPR